MPTRPPRLCSHAGCGALTHERFCEKHRKATRQASDAQRGSSTERGYDRRWRKLRAAFLLQHPLCADCRDEGRTVPAEVVDHVTPHRGNRALLFDVSNLRALCKRHHDSKTAREDGGFGRPRLVRGPSNE